jgi:hypothetical protein
MNTRRWIHVLLLASAAACFQPRMAEAQCCLDGLFAGCASCFRKAPPAYAVAPVMAPVVAPVPAPPPPVVVPVQQVSYVPETTYRTQYQCVPVTAYKPSYEIDPCTGCSRECVQQVTNYVQQAVNVPVTQYRAVYSTKYVQMQQGGPAYTAPAAGMPAYGAPAAAPAPIYQPAPAASQFTAPIQTTPQAWGSAGADIPQQVIQGQTSIAAPTLPQGFVPQNTVPQPVMPQPTFQQQQIVPQGGTYTVPAPAAPGLQPTTPPALQPAPSLKPIPELPRSTNGATGSAVAPSPYAAPPAAQPPALQPPSLVPGTTSGSGTTSGANPAAGPATMPVVPGTGPGAATGAFPRLLEPTSHTTSWQPAPIRPTSYPTAALPGRVQ